MSGIGQAKPPPAQKQHRRSQRCKSTASKAVLALALNDLTHHLLQRRVGQRVALSHQWHVRIRLTVQPKFTRIFSQWTLLNGQKGCYAIGKEQALDMKSRIATTELKSRTSHIERLICWLEKLLIQMLLTLTLWPLKLIYNRPMEAWWVWDTNRKLCMLDQRFC